MGLPDFSVRKPVTTLMIFASVILLGVISWFRLPQEFYPPITFPQLTIKTIYKDAAPEEIEILITKMIEEGVGTVPGLRRISSTSKEEVSLVFAEFNWGQNMDFAALHVREKIDLIKERLPRGAEDPVVLKYNPFERPILVLNVTGERTPLELREFVKKQIKSELEKTTGVAAATIQGGLDREILVEVDQGRLAASGTPIVKISEALSKSNINFPAGAIEEEFYEYLVRAMGEFEVIKQIPEVAVGIDERETPIAMREHPELMSEAEREAKKQEGQTTPRLIYLKDIAKVKDTTKERSSYSRFNGQETVSISILKQAGTHTLQVANNVKDALSRLKKTLPEDIKIDIAYDQSILIAQAISGVRDAAWQGGILAVLVLFFFLRKWLSSLIVGTTIVVSILATFSFMYFGGVTLNMISLGGLALGVGMLVDCGIVVIENIFRHRQMGKKPKEASSSGTQEVVGAVNASVLTTVVVFLPMIFVIGVVGQIFKELAFTIVASLMASLLVAVTLIPMLASKEKEKEVVAAEEPTGLFGKIEDGLRKITDKSLNYVLNNKGRSLFIVFVVFLLSLLILFSAQREFLPKVDQGQFAIKLEMPPGTRLEVTNRVAGRIEEVMLVQPETKFVTLNVGSTKEELGAEVAETLGSHQAEALVTLKPRARLFQGGKDYRKISTSEFIQRLKDALSKYDTEGGYVTYLVQETEFQAAFQQGAPIVVEIKGPKLSTLEELAKDLEKRLAAVKGLYAIKDSIIPPSPESKVFIMKDKAATFNLSVSDIALTAQTAIKGFVATKFKEAGKEVDIRVRLRSEDRKDFNKIRRLIVHSPLGMDVSLAEVAYIGIGKGPTEIRRIGQQRIVLVSANIFKRGLSDAIKDVERKITEMDIPAGFTVALTGEYEQMRDSFNSLVFALVLAIIAVYMIMASQFESLWQPFIILFTFPLCIIGVALALFITNTPMSVMVVLGIIILGGIVVDNGIVLIDFINQLRAQGISAEEAVKQAVPVRLRPILMTSLTTILGLVPLALGISAGTEIQMPMAITVMGGLTVSTFLTLNMIPMIYLGTENLINRIWPKKVIEEEKSISPEEVPVPLERIPAPEEILPEIEKIEEEKPEEKKPEEKKPEEKPSEMKLNSRQKKAIEYLKKNKRITRVEYSKKFKCSIATAGRDLAELVKKGLIKGMGPYAVGRYYELA